MLHDIFQTEVLQVLRVHTPPKGDWLASTLHFNVQMLLEALIHSIRASALL